MKLHHLKEPATKGSENPSLNNLVEGFIYSSLSRRLQL